MMRSRFDVGDFFWGCWLVGLSQPCMGCGSGGSLLHVFLVHVSHSFFFSLKEKWMILTKLNEEDKVWCQRFFFWAFGWSDYRSRAWVAGVAGLLLHVSLAHVSHSFVFR